MYTDIHGPVPQIAVMTLLALNETTNIKILSGCFQLEVTIARLEAECKQAKEKLVSHDTAARATIQGLQADHKGQMEKVGCMH